MDQLPVTRLRIFLSSPGDVSRERQLAREVMDQLESEPLYQDRLKLGVVAWDKPGADTAMPAQMEPQEAIDLRLKKPSQCDIVIVILWSRMGTPLSKKYCKEDGRQYRSGTEYEFLDAMNPPQGARKPDVLVYRCLKEPSVGLKDPERDKKSRQWDLVEEFFSEFQNPDNSFKHSYKSYDEPHEFRATLERDLRCLIQSYMDIPPSNSSSLIQKQNLYRWDPEKSPFPGLQPFTSDESPTFFGRGREIDQLVDMLGDGMHRFISVVGASGSGKSSLVWAGLLPALAKGALPGSKDWVQLRFTPAERSENPFIELASALNRAMGKPGPEIRQMAEQLRTHSEASHSYLETVLAGKPQWAELLLFIDQCEEFFTLVDPEYQSGFVELLAQLARTPRVRVVATLRSDFYHRGLDWPKLNDLLVKGHYPLLAPNAGALYEMITKPAQYAGLQFEKGLRKRILEDTGTEPGALALMAFALRQLWEMSRGTNGLLTYGAYGSFNGVQGAIGKQAEATFRSLAGDKTDLERNLSDLFRQLVEVDERGVPTRRRALRDEITRYKKTNALADKMIQARLLVTSGDEQNQPMVEVAHEALFTHWDRLKAWIEIRKDDLYLQRRIRLAADEWDKEQEDKSKHLWPDTRIKDVARMIERLGVKETDFSEQERRFLGPVERDAMLAKLDDPTQPHELRATIGRRLSLLGDPRQGVGLRPDDLPDIEWCLVSGGQITLDIDRKDAQTTYVHPFYIAKYPVTWCQYEAFIKSQNGFKNPAWWENCPYSIDKPGRQFNAYANHPAENLCWYEAVAFCRWLGHELGYKVNLPTEFQWQQAATGGDPENIYPWGDRWDNDRANTYESELSFTTAVGIYPRGASPLGALDMAGNLWEWCLNEYENPNNQCIGGTETRVLRGGSWNHFRNYARAADRNFFHPYLRGGDVGFRVSCASPIS